MTCVQTLKHLQTFFSKIKKAKIKNINNIVKGNLNINSLPKKFDKLKVLVNGMLDILIITETN